MAFVEVEFRPHDVVQAALGVIVAAGLSSLESCHSLLFINYDQIETQVCKMQS